MPEMPSKIRGKATNCFAGGRDMSQDFYSRILLWFCGITGIFILAVPNQIRWIGLVFVFGGLFLDYQIWKDNRLKEVNSSYEKNKSHDKGNQPFADEQISRK
jgi:hypothetical protein